VNDGALYNSSRKDATGRFFGMMVRCRFGHRRRSLQSILEADCLRHPLAISKNTALESHAELFMASKKYQSGVRSDSRNQEKDAKMPVVKASNMGSSFQDEQVTASTQGMGDVSVAVNMSRY
jgi:hypothetical protein